MHVNLHKTFSTPHGGGGPGAGPVGVKEKLVSYLPISRIIKRNDGTLALNYDYPESIGYIASFYGNFAIILRAYAYILLLGKEGLREAANQAVLNANYLKECLKERFDLAYDRPCMHEVVFSASRQAKRGVHALDIAKFLIDKGIHPPTIYFPLTVKEAMMIVPTETESKETLDLFVKAMFEADDLSQRNPAYFKDLPQSTPITRPDEVKAARDINTNYFKVRFFGTLPFRLLRKTFSMMKHFCILLRTIKAVRSCGFGNRRAFLLSWAAFLRPKRISITRRS
jgi:glycine dehydrogenase subunit 2